MTALSRHPFRRLALRVIGAAVGDPHIASERTETSLEVEREAERALDGDGPIVVGPWLSEVGFEVLYWIPYLRWLQERFSLDPARLVAVSRGGTSSWYRGICDGYVDAFDLLTVEEFRSLVETRWTETGGQKQISLGPWDRAVLERARERVAWNEAHLLHPSLMYRLFRNFWVGRAPVSLVAGRTRFARFEQPESEGLEAELPDEYVAVKFYFRPSFPDTGENRRFVANVVRTLSRTSHVVLLNTGIAVDDHPEFDPGLEHRVLRLIAGTSARDNLAAQTTAIGRARAFIGTYGGLSYLATSMGIPTVGIWSHEKALVPAHVEMGRIASDSLGAPLSALGTQDLDILRPSSAKPPTRGGSRIGPR